jgi:hypothetical protein
MIRNSVVLPQPEGAEESDQLAGMDCQRNVLERREFAEGLANALELEIRVVRCGGRRQGFL